MYQGLKPSLFFEELVSKLVQRIFSGLFTADTFRNVILWWVLFFLTIIFNGVVFFYTNGVRITFCIVLQAANGAALLIRLVDLRRRFL